MHRRVVAFAALHLARDVDDRRARIVHQNRPARGAGEQPTRLAHDERAAAVQMHRRVRPARHGSVHPDDLIEVIGDGDQVILAQVRVGVADGLGRVPLLDAQTQPRVSDIHARLPARHARAPGDADADGAVAVVGRRVPGADSVAARGDGAGRHGDIDVAVVAAVQQRPHRGLVFVGEARAPGSERGVHVAARRHRLQHLLLRDREILRQKVPQEGSGRVVVRPEIRHDLGVRHVVQAGRARVDGGEERARVDAVVSERRPESLHVAVVASGGARRHAR